MKLLHRSLVILAASALALQACTQADADALAQAVNQFLDELIAEYDKVDASQEGGGYVKTDLTDLDNIPDYVPAVTPEGGLPSYVDLSDRVPPVGDQGGQGSCASWAAAYGMASALANARHGWGLGTADHFGSPRSLYAQVLEAQGTGDCDRGATGPDVMEPLAKLGAGSLMDVPYTDSSCGPVDQPSTAGDFQVGSYYDVSPPDDVQAMKAELANGSVIMWGAFIYDDFQEFQGSDVYSGSGNFLQIGEQHAGHMMLLVGYDDNRGAFRVMNSWGPDWGDHGFVWMAYNTFVDWSTKDPDGTYRGEAWVARPLSASVGKPGALSVSPRAEVTRAEARIDARGEALLIFGYRFDGPMTLLGLTATDPEGHTAEQSMRVTATNGDVHFKRRDGLRWMSGPYAVTFELRTLDGEPFTFQDTVLVGPPTAQAVEAQAMPESGFGPGTLDASARPARIR